MDAKNGALQFLVLVIIWVIWVILLMTVDTNIKVTQIANDYAWIKCDDIQ